jgi:hypothetical protein
MNAEMFAPTYTAQTKSHAKIAKLRNAILGQQNVLRLDVQMENRVSVQISKSLKTVD